MKSQVTAAVELLHGPVHIIGIGGAGMSGIARILIASGVSVSGSDAKESRRLAALRALGAHVVVGHDGSNLPENTRCVVISTAIPASNPEIVEAQQRNIPVIARAVALAAVMEGFDGVSVAGTHGKTTTTSMLTVAIQRCGADPSFAIGSELHSSGANAHLGSGRLFIVEADESDGSFLWPSPVAGIVTNVEPDHLNHWGTFEAVEGAFAEFVDGICSRGGFAVVCADEPGAARLIASARAKGHDVRSYGESDGADYRIDSVDTGSFGWSFDVIHRGLRLGRIGLNVPGKHNALNATAALAVGLGLGFPAGPLIEGLESFTGTRRRFEFKGEVDGIRVYDDYAHHPTEIDATLRAARQVVGPNGRIVVAFQAHHYYRTAMFSREFGEALGLADEVVVLEVFAPGEEPIPGASGQTMASHVPLGPEHVVFEPSWSAVPEQLANRARRGDLVMTLGAGEIGLLGPEVLELLRTKHAR